MTGRICPNFAEDPLTQMIDVLAPAILFSKANVTVRQFLSESWPWIIGLFAMLACGVVALRIWNTYVDSEYGEPDNENALLINFKDLQHEGDLSAAEFKDVQERLRQQMKPEVESKEEEEVSDSGSYPAQEE